MSTDTLTATLEYQGRHQDPDGWEHNLYKATLHYQGRRMTTQFDEDPEQVAARLTGATVQT